MNDGVSLLLGYTVTKLIARYDLLLLQMCAKTTWVSCYLLIVYNMIVSSNMDFPKMFEKVIGFEAE